jgi:hypothetical protein
MIFRTADVTPNGISIASNGTNLTRITFANTGIYNIQFSSQFQNLSNAPQDVTIWLRKNGTDVPGSAGVVGLEARKNPGDPYHIVAGWNYVLSVVGGDYYELVWSTTDHTNVEMRYYAAGNPPPSAASVILTVTQQSGIMAGTGLTALNGLTGAVQTFSNDTNVTITSAGTTHTLGWSGTLADGRIASATNWNTAYTNRITSLTTTGSSGAATLSSNTLNIPNYTADGILPSQTGNSGKYLTTNGTTASWGTISVPTGANPSATIGLTAVNGSASTFMRSDGAPALDQTIAPTWTGKHIFNPTLTSTGNATSLNITTSGAVAAGTIVSAIYSNITDGFTGGNTRHLRGLDINMPNAQLVFTNNGSPTTPSTASTVPSLFINRTGSSGNSYIAFATTGSLNAGMRFNTGGNIDIGAFISGGYYPTFWSNNAEVGRFTATNGNLLIGTTTDAASTDKVQANGNLNLITAGNKIKIATGTNASIGTSGAIAAGTVTVSTTAVTANSKIFLSRASAAGTLGLLSVGTITAGSSFTITSSNTLDTSTVNWWIIN